MLIEQAIYGGQDAGGYRFLARSSGFLDDWLSEAQRLCTGFGDRPAGVTCPLAVFARPFGSRHVAVVQAADQGRDDAGRPGALAFRLLVLPSALYADLGGDPFLAAAAFPPAWEARGELPALSWSAGPPPKRTVADLRRVLDVAPERTALLLGGAQVLVDGGRLVFERPAPDPQLLADLWMLLPTSTRTTLWPATFAFGNAHGFHVLAVPQARGADYEHYVPEAQAGDYPEGRYELALQTAVESGDQAEVDALFARRSRKQTLRLAVVLLLVFLIVPPLVLGLPLGKRDRRPAPPKKDGASKPEKAAEPLKLPPADAFVPLTAPQRKQFAAHLKQIGDRLGVDLPAGDSEAELGEAVVELDRALDRKRRPARDPGNLTDLGPAQRRLRALAWKHGVGEYAEPGLNPVEVLERLESRLVEEGLIKEE
jgi:hypothetical protein